MPDNTKINAPTKTDPGTMVQNFGATVHRQAVYFVYSRAAGGVTDAQRDVALLLALPLEPNHGDPTSRAAQLSREAYATLVWHTVVTWMDLNTAAPDALIALARKSNPYDSTPEG